MRVLQPEKFKMFRRDFFPALRSFITRDCMDTSVILSIFSYTWYWLQNRIFLTLSDNYWILNRKIQAGIRQTCIFRTPLGGVVLFSSHGRKIFGRLIMLLAKYLVSIHRYQETFLSNQKVRGPKRMRVFITRFSLIYSGRNSTCSCRDFFPAHRSFITRDCMGTSVILTIFPRLDIHSKIDFSWLYPTII